MTFSIRKIVTLVVIAFALIIGTVIVSKSINNIEPGNRGVIFYKLGDGLDTDNILEEGFHFILPWNELIQYDVRQKNVDLVMNVLDKNGLDVGIDISIVYRPMVKSIGKLHLKTGRDYENIVVIPRTRSAGREVTGQFNAEELYSTKRDALQTQIESILAEKFTENFLKCEDVLIRDVNLPDVIRLAIEAKEAQNQKNDLAEKLEAEAQSRANALVAKAEGVKKSDILVAEGQARAIELKQAQLKKSPQYIELLKVQGYATTGASWYGTNNVFGDGAATVIKGLR